MKEGYRNRQLIRAVAGILVGLETIITDIKEKREQAWVRRCGNLTWRMGSIL